MLCPFGFRLRRVRQLGQSRTDKLRTLAENSQKNRQQGSTMSQEWVTYVGLYAAISSERNLD